MTEIPLVPETKMVDVGKLITRELIGQKSHMICIHNYVRIFDFIPRFWSCPPDKDCLYILSSSKNSFSHILISRDSTLSISISRNNLTMPISKTQPNTRNVGAYIFCDLFFSCSAFSVRLVPVSNTASEISSNPERDK